MERETGIEPATNSLEGCDSTTELLPPTRSPLRFLALRRASPLLPPPQTARQTPGGLPIHLRALALRWTSRSSPGRATFRARRTRAKVGGEGRTRTFEAARATDLQSAAFDRFATSPAVCVLETRVF